ncbi:MAG: metallophosphoesterase [Microgenomates group bacterium]|nr:MAG: metallophosphoesterase [Candidatus Roizmanbacteria bacterium]
MRYLIFSDTHLTPTFEPKKFAILKDAIKQVDKVIINGDFWEGYAGTFHNFVSSRWAKELFPLLKSKKAVYLFGNHDPRRLADKRMDLFSDYQEEEFVFKSGTKTFHIMHGNRIVVFPDVSARVRIILEFVEGIVLKIFGKLFIRLAYKRFNNYIKKKIPTIIKDDKYLITGHTHFAEVDLENRYLNEGFIHYGYAQYLFIEDGNVTAVEKRY